MICPNCRSKVKFLTQIETSKKFNFKKGFYCPACNTKIRVANMAQISSIFSVLLFFLYYSEPFLIKISHKVEASYWIIVVMPIVFILAMFIINLIFDKLSKMEICEKIDEEERSVISTKKDGRFSKDFKSAIVLLLAIPIAFLVLALFMEFVGLF